jgi:hypothetical protein
MRVPLSWLREYVDFDLTPQALAEELTMQGLEVSGIEVSGADWSDVVVGRLLSVERHPDADKLWLTSVDVGSGEDASNKSFNPPSLRGVSQAGPFAVLMVFRLRQSLRVYWTSS